MDDRTIGLVLRAVRRRRGWRQADLAAAAGCSQSLVSLVERGHLESVAFGLLRRIFGALDVRLRLFATWRGADLDRLLDEDHAAVVAGTADRLERAGWQVLIEVTCSRYGERGSIDVLGVHAVARAVLVCEIKSDVPSAEATVRKGAIPASCADAVVLDYGGCSAFGSERVPGLPRASVLHDGTATRMGTRMAASGGRRHGNGRRGARPGPPQLEARSYAEAACAAARSA